MAILASNTCLHPGQSLQSSNGLHTFTLQTDGNVVLYNHQNQPLWSTNTYGITPRDFFMQPDGNLVLYDTSGTPKWASNTGNNPGAFLNVQDDGNLVVYRAGSQTETANNALWATASNDMPTPGDGQGTPPAPSGGGIAQECLNYHNSYRAQVGVPPLTWSDTLAQSAQQWANQLAATKSLAHSRSGENLASANNSQLYPSVTQTADAWGQEKQHFVGGTFPNVSNTGNWEDIGHYTQMVWRNTTEVGCGLAHYDDDQSMPGYILHNTVLVCHYNPAGNVTGQSVY
jgi:hypothetical protein